MICWIVSFLGFVLESNQNSEFSIRVILVTLSERSEPKGVIEIAMKKE